MISVNFTQNPRYLFFKPPLKEYGQINNKNDVNPVTAGSHGSVVPGDVDVAQQPAGIPLNELTVEPEKGLVSVLVAVVF